MIIELIKMKETSLLCLKGNDYLKKKKILIICHCIKFIEMDIKITKISCSISARECIEKSAGTKLIVS